MVGAHLLGSRLPVDVLEHLLCSSTIMVAEVIACFPSQVFCATILPAWVDLFLQWSDSADQAVGGHADPGQA
jgi:hypothetical protein